MKYCVDLKLMFQTCYLKDYDFVWQVIESAFQQDRGQGASVDNLSKNDMVGKGQVTARTALKELRKISILLSEM